MGCLEACLHKLSKAFKPGAKPPGAPATKQPQSNMENQHQEQQLQQQQQQQQPQQTPLFNSQPPVSSTPPTNKEVPTPGPAPKLSEQRKSKSRKERDDSTLCPPYAAKSVVGQRFTMEDSYAAIPECFLVPRPWIVDYVMDQLPVLQAPPAVPDAAQVPGTPASPPDGTAGEGTAVTPTTPPSERPLGRRSVGGVFGRSGAAPSSTPAVCTPPPATPAIALVPGPPTSGPMSSSEGEHVQVHFFAVYDGHGGAEVAKHCSKKLHEHLKDIITKTSHLPPGSNPVPSSQPAVPKPTDQPATASPEQVQPELAPAASTNGEEPAITTVVQPTDGNGVAVAAAAVASSGSEAQSLQMEEVGVEAALIKAFLTVDQELAKERSAHEMGTTAVVALLAARYLWVANCGDSRAVLCRSGEAVPLSLDHKASRNDEVMRVEQAGGYVWWDRVMGELAVSRAIGDHCLRPFVIAEPEVTRVTRRASDQLLLLASDGLWDVFSNQEACNLALEKFNGELGKGSSSRSAVKKAASSLTKTALARGSRDNITVVVVDVRYQGRRNHRDEDSTDK